MNDHELAQVLWDFHVVGQTPKAADAILALGGPDTRVAEHAAQLCLDGLAPVVVCTGGIAHQDDLLATGWDVSEASVFAEVVTGCGVAAGQVLIEDRAKNTRENIEFSRDVLRGRAASAVIVTKPHMERRALATATHAWPGCAFTVTSPQIAFADYPTDKIPFETVTNLMVGDLQRLWFYGERGLLTPQVVPELVLGAFAQLVERGYDRHLVSGAPTRPSPG